MAELMAVSWIAKECKGMLWGAEECYWSVGQYPSDQGVLGSGITKEYRVVLESAKNC